MLLSLRILFLVLACATSCLLTPLSAQTNSAANSTITDHVRASLLSEHDVINPGSSIWVGLRLELEEGWHTYWKYPGDSGLATSIRWTLPPGFEAGTIQWPIPKRIPYESLMNFGYEDEVLLLTEIKVSERAPTTSPAILTAKASWLVCEAICIPEEAILSITLRETSDGRESSPRWSYLFDQTRSNLPTKAPWPVHFSLSDDLLLLTAEINNATRQGIVAASYFPIDYGIIKHAADQTFSISNNKLVLAVTSGDEVKNERTEISGLLVVQDSSDQSTGYLIDSAPVAYEIEPIRMGNLTFLTAILFAFLGGLLLNLMPCVLPILSMKVMGFISQDSKETRRLRLHGLSYTAGVMTSFSILVALLLLIQAGGEQIGWGFQLQSPVFVTILAYVFLSLGLSLSGVFTIGGNLIGVGTGIVNRDSGTESFFTGVLAAIVATPCTAPFMGVSIGFALTQPAFVTAAVFEALALGLAAPYLLLCFVPTLANRLPKAGAWTETFRQFLAFPLYGSAAWLLWVMSQQVGPDGTAAAFAGAIFVAFGAWLWGKAQFREGQAGKINRVVAVLSMTAALALMRVLVFSQPAPAASTYSESTIQWTEFSQARVDSLRSQGRAVFVNFTAAWCITCMVNEGVALNSETVADALEAGNIATLEADWTNRNPAIAAHLRSFGRAGVPLYVLYPAGSGAPKILPALLTEEVILDAINQL